MLRVMIAPKDIAPERARGLSRREYEKLVRLGLFGDERIELLHRVIVQMSPQEPLHAEVVNRLNRLLVPLLLDHAQVRIQSPLALGEEHEPEPDVAVVPPGDYRNKHPGQALLIVEVASSSLRKDRQVKQGIYATAAVPEYWIVNLVDGCLEVHRRPKGETYSLVIRHGPGDEVALEAFPGLAIRVDDIIP